MLGKSAGRPVSTVIALISQIDAKASPRSPSSSSSLSLSPPPHAARARGSERHRRRRSLRTVADPRSKMRPRNQGTDDEEQRAPREQHDERSIGALVLLLGDGRGGGG